MSEQSVDQKLENAAAIVVSSSYASTASYASIRARQSLLLYLPKKVRRVSLGCKKKGKGTIWE